MWASRTMGWRGVGTIRRYDGYDCLMLTPWCSRWSGFHSEYVDPVWRSYWTNRRDLLYRPHQVEGTVGQAWKW